MDSSGNLYGTTEYGGVGHSLAASSGDGTVFELAKGSTTITTLASFQGANGENPVAGLIMESSGDLYGTTEFGGIGFSNRVGTGDGTVFEVTKGSSTITPVAYFSGANGQAPQGGLIPDSSGNLYGTTGLGGASKDGTVFEVGAGSGAITTMISFGGSNGEDPVAGLIIDSSGNLDGTTMAGGANGDGTVFEVPTGASAAVLQSIAVSPANPSVPNGETEQFTATGTYSDNSTQNLTSQVTWASATPSVATISDTSGSQGLATGVALGTTTISATLNGVAGSTVLTVSAAVLQSIAVSPANPSVAKGETEQFTATGTYSDNSKQNLTSQVTWVSATPSVATISGASGSQGLATGVALGTSTISATLNGVVGSTVLTVSAAVLQSIAVSPANPSLPKGETEQFTATGTYSDNSTQNLTRQVTWASATTSVATISDASGSQGLATGVAAGHFLG